MTTLPIYGSMLTSVVFDRAFILSWFGSLVLSGPDIPSACFDPYIVAITRLSATIVASGSLPNLATSDPE
jgi:hypothetical protein